MATIRKRINKAGSVTFHVQIRMKGTSTQTASFDRLTDAKKWAGATEAAIREGRHFKTAEAKRHTLSDSVERYCKEILPEYSKREIQERRAKLEWWSNGIGHYLLSDINQSIIAEQRTKLDRSATTRNRYLAALSHCFTIAVNEWQWLEENPTRKIRKLNEPRGRVRFLNDDERERLLGACKESNQPWLYLCVVLALSSGMRQGEQMSLKWQDIDLKEGYLILHETKNGERRRIPLSRKVVILLKGHSKVRRLDTDLLFPGKNPQSPVDLRKPWMRALQDALIDDFRWHDLRHSAASYLAMNGASLAEISEILGHKTLQMVKRYSHLSDSHVSSVVEKMNTKIFGDK